MSEYVAICEEDCVWRKVVPQIPDDRPISQPSIMSLLLPLPPMYGDDARAGLEDPLCILQTLLLGVENSHLRRDRDVQLIVQLVDQTTYQVLILLQERAIVSLPRNSLWAPQVQVYCITPALYVLRRLEEISRRIGAELDEQWAVSRLVAV